jgi:hypothetical protein
MTARVRESDQDFRSRVSDLGFRISGFGYRILGFKFRISGPDSGIQPISILRVGTWGEQFDDSSRARERPGHEVEVHAGVRLVEVARQHLRVCGGGLALLL